MPQDYAPPGYCSIHGYVVPNFSRDSRLSLADEMSDKRALDVKGLYDDALTFSLESSVISPTRQSLHRINKDHHAAMCGLAQRHRAADG